MKWRDYIKKCAMMACVSLATLWGFVVYAAPGFTMRIDDNHSVAEWERVAEIFGSRGIRLSFAVVTSTLSEDQGKCLRRFSEKGHVIMDHTPNHTFYRAKYHDRAAFDRAKVKPFVVEVNEPEMTLFFRCEADDAHPKNRRVRASIDKNVITFENAQGVHGSYEFIKIPGHEGVYGLAKGQKSFELRDFWRRPLTGTIDLAATEVLVYDQAALQPCDDVLRELATISRERFEHFSLPRPTIWVRPGGWDPGVSWERLERIYGREFGYVGADSRIGKDVVWGGSRWTTGYDEMYFFDQGPDITPEQLVERISKRIAEGKCHVTLSHMWHKVLPGGQTEWFEKTERFAQLLVERKIPVQTMSESLSSRFGAQNKSTSVSGAATAWTFHSAPLAADEASGNEIAADVHTLRVPSRGGCGWWSTNAAIEPKGEVRFRATVEIAMDDAKDFVHNDFAMFVRWDFPKDNKDRSKSGNGVDKGKFYQRDFIAYTDKVDGGKIIRTFDEMYAVPGESDSVEIEFIGKWHAMTAMIRDVKVESVARPKPRRVRCVVGNPFEATGYRIIAARRKAGEMMTGEKTMAVQLAQIETCLTNIFAQVEKPDIILFSECLAQQGAPDPASVAEPIPGGPSWKLAEKYATKYSCNIAMNVKEREANGQCHNTVFVCDRQGKLAGLYRKVHLTSGEYQQGLVPGDGFPVFDLDFGRVGALVCWDNWFSESIKMVKRNGAELILFPLAGCAMDHVDTVFPSRAIDAGIPILVAMRQGHLPNGIIDRDGQWIAKTFEDCGFAVAELDLNERKRTFWLSVGPGQGDPYELYYDESRPEIYEKFDWRQPRK